jgi:tyrosine phenol-lyase
MTSPLLPTPCGTFEPFRVKIVEPIRLTTPQERRRILDDVQHNLFRIPADQVMIDLITDSGTGAMSSRQWAAMMRGDESYAGSASHDRLVEACQRVFGFRNVLPTHQGRVSERLLVETLIGPPHDGNGCIVPNNAHFDTTRRMIEASGAEAWNLLCAGGDEPNNAAPFKGNLDARKLEKLLQDRSDDAPFVMLTITCNSNGGQPVSLENLREVRTLCDRWDKLLILDACRFAENAWFIKKREPGQKDRSIHSIVREMFDCADGVVMSTRKDGLCNAGGLLLLRDDRLFRKACSRCVLTEGFTMTYGSLPARDLEAIAIGMQEVMEETYLSGRIGAVEHLGDRLFAGGVPVVQPSGGHAIYIDAEKFCPHLGCKDHPADALACAIYEHGGIRASRIGSVLRNKHGQPMELVRLAIPRRTYTQAHLDYVAHVIIDLRSRAAQIEAVKNEASGAVRYEEPEFQAA